MNPNHYTVQPDDVTAAYVRHEQTLITSSDVDDTRNMVQVSVAARIPDVVTKQPIGDFMRCPNCGKETGGAKYCGKCS